MTASRTPGAAPTGGWPTTWRLVVCAVVGAISWAGTLLGDRPAWWVALDALVGAASLGLLLVRRRHPLLVVWLLLAASVPFASVSGSVLLALTSLATRRRWTEIVPASIGFVGAGALEAVLLAPGPVDWAFELGTAVSGAAICAALGVAVGNRRELVTSLRARAAAAEREQAARVAQGQATERARIAREMHDVLAHRISLVAMHAGILVHRPDLPRDDVARTAGVVQDNAHRALEELRAVLGVLRQDADAPQDAHAPQPTLADLPELLAESAALGVPVQDTVASQTRTCLADLDDTVSRHAYRVIQEGLTNARKHAAGARVHVDLRGGPGGDLEVRVSDRGGAPRATPAAPGAGVGLIGLAERVRLAGGTLAHGPEDDGFVLTATFPWRPKEHP